MGCFPVDFQEVKRPLRLMVGKRPINEGKRPIKAKVLVGVSVGCLMGCFRAPPPWRKTAPLKRPIKRSRIYHPHGQNQTSSFGFGLQFPLSCWFPRKSVDVVPEVVLAFGSVLNQNEGLGILVRFEKLRLSEFTAEIIQKQYFSASASAMRITIPFTPFLQINSPPVFFGQFLREFVAAWILHKNQTRVARFWINAGNFFL